MITKLSGFVVDDCARLPRGGHHLPIHRSSRLHQQHRGTSPLPSFVFFLLWLILSHVSLSFYPLSFCTVVHQVRNVLNVQSDENSSFEVTTIATTTGPLSEVYFPSVIVCSINQIRKSLFRVGSQKQQHYGHLRVRKFL